MTKHTPGPWRFDTSRLSVHAIVDAKGQDLAYQDVQPSFYQGEPCGSVTSRGRTAEELAANAALIAAAPDLLKACSELIRHFCPSTDKQTAEANEWFQFALAAIAKGKGRAK